MKKVIPKGRQEEKEEERWKKHQKYIKEGKWEGRWESLKSLCYWVYTTWFVIFEMLNIGVMFSPLVSLLLSFL